VRDDMSHLLVERGHSGRSWRSDKGRFRFQHVRGEDAEEMVLSRAEPIRQPHFSENFAPLLRFLRRQVGRSWDRVHADICRGLRLDSAVQKHVRDHLEDFVATRSWMVDGVAWVHRRRFGPTAVPRGRGFAPSPRRFYVCPRGGLLRCWPTETKRERARRRLAEAAPRDHIGIERDHDYRLLGGHWFECWLGTDADGQPVILRKRGLSHRDKRDLGLLPEP